LIIETVRNIPTSQSTGPAFRWPVILSFGGNEKGKTVPAAQRRPLVAEKPREKIDSYFFDLEFCRIAAFPFV